MNEAFARFESDHLGIPEADVRRCLTPHSTANTSLVLSVRADAKVWQAALAHLRGPQTSATCKAVPPHPKGCWEPDPKGNEAWHKTFPGMGRCLVCEAVAKARDAALREADELAKTYITGVAAAAAIHRLRGAK